MTPALLTDLHSLMMAAGYFRHGMHEKRVSFELSVRRLPPQRRYLLVAGLESALSQLAELRFTEAQLDYLREVPGLRGAMSFELVEHLRGFRFRGDVQAMTEGTVAFAGEPLVRVTGTLLEATLVESLLLSVVNTETALASKASRLVQAAAGAEVVDLGTRRTSPHEAVAAARAAFVAGFSATSNVEAGMRWDIPLSGDAAHSWTMAHATEDEAFRRYAEAHPRSTALVVDTYDTLEGTRRAIAAAGERLRAVRLDSGDLDALSRGVRALLDAAGLAGARIVASGDLDEGRIRALRRAGAPIDAFAVGTQLVRPSDAPSLGGVYKLVYDHAEGRSVAKFSEGKVSLPGLHQVFRLRRDGTAIGDVVGMETEWHLDAVPLLHDWMRGGRLVRPLPSLAELRAHARAQVGALPEALRAVDLEEAPPYPVTLSDGLRALLGEVRRREVQG
jgi:nicotinate phosphoribosyltransferase